MRRERYTIRVRPTILASDGVSGRHTYIEAPQEKRTIATDRISGQVLWEFSESDGTYRIDDIDLTVNIRMGWRFTIRPNDPTSVRAEIRWFRAYSRGAWRVSAESTMVLTSDRDAF